MTTTLERKETKQAPYLLPCYQIGLKINELELNTTKPDGSAVTPVEARLLADGVMSQLLPIEMSGVYAEVDDDYCLAIAESYIHGRTGLLINQMSIDFSGSVFIKDATNPYRLRIHNEATVTRKQYEASYKNAN